MTIWYVRPDTSHNTTRNGTSYATAWGGWSEIVWGASGVNAGDTLYVCGAHVYTASKAVGAHGATSDANRTTIRGDYATSPGSITFNTDGWIDATRKYTTFKALTVTSNTTTRSGILISATDGVIVDSCTFFGGGSGVGLYGPTVFTSCTVKDCVMSGQVTGGVVLSSVTPSIAPSGITITGNTIHDTSLYGIAFFLSSAAWTSTTINNVYIANNAIYNTAGASIYLLTCNNDQSTAPTVYSTGLVISGNTIHNCGTAAGTNGNHGGLMVMGFISPIIKDNVVTDTYVTGGGIQTAKNKSPLIVHNTVTSIRSGTPTASYQNGYPIDGNGIFFDILTVGGQAYGNYISDLVSTGNDNSGTGIAFWNCTGAKAFGNVIKDCYRGMSYGHANETGNEVYNNTFVSCSVGVNKLGTSSLTGNITVKNNVIHSCTTGFSIGTNPGITADYNCLYGSTTAYSGISAGSNDLSVDPQLDNAFRPATSSVKTSGTALSGHDFYGSDLTPGVIGAVNAFVARSVATRSIRARVARTS